MSTNPAAAIDAADITIERLCAACVENGASDIHLKVGIPPFLRINTRLRPIIGCQPLSAADTERLAREVVPDAILANYDVGGSGDCSYEAAGGARFRVAVYRANGAHALALRLIPNRIRTPEEIGLPQAILSAATRPRGLILVTGPTGSGKSTSLASIIDYLNTTRDHHIVTFEDPVEHQHAHKRSIISQREIGRDTPDFPSALRAVLRADPNVILVGELRDLETTRTALRAAETGHLVLATTHTVGAAATVNYLIDAFPTGEQEHIRVQLSCGLLAVMSQALCERADEPGMVAAYELMLVNPAIQVAVRKDRPFGVDDVIRAGRRDGMQLLDEHLVELAVAGKISGRTAVEKSRDPVALTEQLKKMRIETA
jgi:twitching motility protein PilT